jgi:hypothetical protein
MVNDQDAVGRQVNVQLQAVGASRDASIECETRVFRAKGAPAPVGKDQGTRGLEERHRRKCSWQPTVGNGQDGGTFGLAGCLRPAVS